MKIEKVEKEITYINTKKGNFIEVNEKDDETDIVNLILNKSEQLRVKIGETVVYQTLPDKVLKYPKKLWIYLSQVSFETEDNLGKYKNLYFYNQYGKDITVIFDENGDIRFRVDYYDIKNVEKNGDVNKEILDKMKEAEKEIVSICEKNNLFFELSHYMDRGTEGVDCWYDIRLRKQDNLNIDALNYLYLLLNRFDDFYS